MKKNDPPGFWLWFGKGAWAALDNSFVSTVLAAVVVGGPTVLWTSYGPAVAAGTTMAGVVVLSGVAIGSGWLIHWTRTRKIPRGHRYTLEWKRWVQTAEERIDPETGKPVLHIGSKWEVMHTFTFGDKVAA